MNTARDCEIFRLAQSASSSSKADSYQQRVGEWADACFGRDVALDPVERNQRFVEESLELAQACGFTRQELDILADYVFSRPVGEKAQEVGGVMTTLATLCRAHGLDMQSAAEVELQHIWTRVEAIRAKRATKPKNSPLPTA